MPALAATLCLSRRPSLIQATQEQSRGAYVPSTRLHGRDLRTTAAEPLALPPCAGQNVLKGAQQRVGVVGATLMLRWFG